MIEHCPSCGVEMWSADTLLYEYQQRKGICLTCEKAAKAEQKAAVRDAKLALKAEQLETKLMDSATPAPDGKLSIIEAEGGELSMKD